MSTEKRAKSWYSNDIDWRIWVVDTVRDIVGMMFVRVVRKNEAHRAYQFDFRLHTVRCLDRDFVRLELPNEEFAYVANDTSGRIVYNKRYRVGIPG